MQPRNWLVGDGASAVQITSAEPSPPSELSPAISACARDAQRRRFFFPCVFCAAPTEDLRLSLLQDSSLVSPLRFLSCWPFDHGRWLCSHGVTPFVPGLRGRFVVWPPSPMAPGMLIVFWVTGPLIKYTDKLCSIDPTTSSSLVVGMPAQKRVQRPLAPAPVRR